MNIVTLKAPAIKPYWKNPRKNDATVAALVESIDKYGYNVPIVVDGKNVILAGHARYRALCQLGRTDIPVVKVTHLTDEQARRFRIADNKSGEFSGWDIDILKKELEAMGVESVASFFDSPQWRQLLDIKELQGEVPPPSGSASEAAAFKANRPMELMCPHCLEEMVLTRDEYKALVAAARAEQAASASTSGA